MPAVPPYITKSPSGSSLRPCCPNERKTDHPFGYHRPRIPDRVVFEKLVAVLVFGCAYWRIAEEGCSATTLRRRRDEWIEMGLMDALEGIALAAYDRIIGLELADVSVDGCITKAPCSGQKAGKSPVDRGKQGIKRSTMVDAKGIPVGVVSAPANRHDSPLLSSTLEVFADLPEHSRVHLDKAYDSKVTRRLLEERGLVGVISEKGNRAPLTAGLRWVVGRTNSWHNAHKKLVWCTEREGRVIDFWIAFSNVIIIVRRLIRQAWSRYRWEDRLVRCP
jgi:hypothetical protein